MYLHTLTQRYSVILTLSLCVVQPMYCNKQSMCVIKYTKRVELKLAYDLTEYDWPVLK